MLTGTTLLVSTEPQLAVCRGLINHAKQHVSMFPRRMARASFGVACRIRYASSRGDRWKTIQKEAKKDGRIKTDEFNQKWIEGCMDWFVAKVGPRIFPFCPFGSLRLWRSDITDAGNFRDRESPMVTGHRTSTSPSSIPAFQLQTEGVECK